MKLFVGIFLPEQNQSCQFFYKLQIKDFTGINYKFFLIKTIKMNAHKWSLERAGFRIQMSKCIITDDNKSTVTKSKVINDLGERLIFMQITIFKFIT